MTLALAQGRRGQARFPGLSRPGLQRPGQAGIGGPAAGQRPVEGPRPAGLSPVSSDGRFIAPWVPVRSTVGVPGFEQRRTGRVRVGGAGGADVPEQVVNVTQAAGDDVHPIWSLDQTSLFFASNRQLGKYQLYQVGANASVDPNSPAPAAARRLTNDPTSDFYFPVVNPNNTRIAFVRSINGAPPQLYAASLTNLTAGGFIDLTEGQDRLVSLTARSTAVPIAEVQRPAWRGATEIVFSGRLQGQAVFHLFSVDVTSGLILQLSDGAASELNPAVSPEGNYIAFDTNATSYVGGGTPRDAQNNIAGNPATATGLTGGGARNVFIISNLGANAIQFTNAPGSHVEPAWSTVTAGANNPINPQGRDVYIAFASTRRDIPNPAIAGQISNFVAGTTFDIYYRRALDPVSGALDTGAGAPAIERPAAGSNVDPLVRKLDTADPNYQFNDEYPTWSPFISIFRIAHQTDRSGTQFKDQIGQGFTPTPGAHDLFISSVVDITAPTLLRYDTSTQSGEVVHINIGNNFNAGAAVRTTGQGVVPGTTLFFTVRVEDRESGLQPEKEEGGRGAVFLIFKNPNSKYQQQSGQEHKEWFPGSTVGLRATNFPVTLGNAPQPFMIDVPNSPTGREIEYGFEYEAQAISAQDYSYYYHTPTQLFSLAGNLLATTIAGPRVPQSRSACYTASVQDLQAFAGVRFPPQDGGTYTPPTGGPTQTTPAIWLPLKRLPQTDQDRDTQGGVLYGASWRIPSQASDFYIDVVAYDNAVNPYRNPATPNVDTGRFNFIIYDNVWGFSSVPFSGLADLLVVSDYTLGQKFQAGRFGPDAGGTAATNVLPVFFGSESYFTDVDMERNPRFTYSESATGDFPYKQYDQTVPFTVSPKLVIGRLFESAFGIWWRSQVPGGSPGTAGLNPFTTENPPRNIQGFGFPNTLGVNSYVDEFSDDRTRVDGRPYPVNGRYEIWRILSRGPIPRDVFTAYQPQPSVTTPPDLANGETAPRQARSVNRMIIWNSTFTRPLFAGPGTIVDPETQAELTNFVAQGGRLFLSGQNVGFALVTGQSGRSFFSDVLKAQFVNDSGGGSFLVSTAAPAGRDNSVADDPWTVNHAYGFFDGNTPYPYSPPSAQNIPVTSYQAGGRFESSLTSAFAPFDVGSTRQFPFVSGRLDVISALGPDAYSQFNYNSGNAGIIVSRYGNNDGRVVFSSLGFESIGYEFYQGGSNPGRVFNYGRRAEIMHNITCSFRTGTIVGQVLNASQGNTPLSDVLVRAVRITDYTEGGDPNKFKATATAATDTNGRFQLIGLPPDAYALFAVRRGFTIQQNLASTVHGGSVSRANIIVTETPPGELTGTILVGDGKTPLQGIEVQVRDFSPTTLAPVLVARSQPSGADGRYRIPGIPTGSYRVVANPANVRYDARGNVVLGPDGNPIPIAPDDPLFNANYRPGRATVFVTDPKQTNIRIGTGTTVTAADQGGLLVIRSRETAGLDFILPAAPQPISGRVFDANNPNPATNGLVGATVTATRVDAEGKTVTIGTVTTGPNGVYSFGPIEEGTITLTAQGLGYTPNSISVAVAGAPVTNADIGLTKAPPGSITGSVKNVVTGELVAGVRVQLFAGTLPLAAGATPIAETTTTAGAPGATTNFAFATVEIGNYVVRAISPNATTRIQVASTPSTLGTQADAAITVVSNQATNVPFELLPPGSLSGLVTRLGTGQVVTDATVQLYQNGVLVASITTGARQTAADGYVFNYRFDNLPAGTYNVRVNKDGLPTSPDEAAGIVVNPGQETRNINFSVRPLFIYADGIQLISTPRDYRTVDPRSLFGLSASGDNDGNGVPGQSNDQTVFSVFRIADWTGQDYNITSDTPFVVGKGYFVRLGATASVNLLGGQTPGPGAQAAIPLPYAGWHLIGNPFDPATVGDLDLATSITVVEPADYNGDGRTEYSLAEATQAGSGGVVNNMPIALVRNVVYYYTGSNSGSQYIQDNRLRPWLGYWFRTFRSVTLRLTAPAATTRSVGNAKRTVTYEEQHQSRARAITSRGPNDWRLQVGARQGELLDTDNSIGVSPGAGDGFDFRFDNEKPPRIENAPSVSLAFQGNNETGRAAGFTDDIRAADGAPKTYTFTVAAAPGKGDVTVFWPNIARVPRSVEPTLIDTLSGRRVPMRSASSYRFTPSTSGEAAQGARRFVIEVKAPPTRPLDILNARVVSTSGGRVAGGGSQRIVFRTTQQADVQVEVSSITGTRLRSLRTRAVAGQESSVSWDGKSEAGTALPAGPYIISLTARDDQNRVVVKRLPTVRLN